MFYKIRTVRWLVLATALSLSFLALPAYGQSPGDQIEAVHQEISNWQLPQASDLLKSLETSGHGEHPDVLFARARHAFFSGSYKTSLDLVDQALIRAKDDHTKRGLEGFRKLVNTTYETTRNYKEFQSPKGYFTLRIEAGKDEVVVPYALETLDEAYDNLGEHFGHRPPTPIIVEMYPTAETLARVSPLTEENIKTSGTIALCKYNRLMFTSPKALLKGYSWRDTMSHEFAHLVITQRSNNTAPIWMHEGLAKYNERLWRKGQEPRMLPSSENILSKGIKKNELITFEEMHPSMARLPSQEATAMAFAEVYTVMEYLESQKGRAVFAELLTLMRKHGDAERAMSELLGVPFSLFERKWTKYLKTRPSKAFDGDFVNVEKLTFADEKPGSELLEIGQKEARGLVHLGELLQARDRYRAAVEEYQKARELIGNHNPILQKRLGKSLIALKQYQEAVDVLALSLEYYPNYHETYALLGEALFRLGRLPEAEENLIEAVGINPFNPAPHSFLAQIYEATGRQELAARARRFARMVGG